MEKSFDVWNQYKKLIQVKEKLVNFHERELWWASCGLNVGVEIDGKHDTFERPCIILRKFNRHMMWVLPTTSQTKNDLFHVRFTKVITFLKMNESPP